MRISIVIPAYNEEKYIGKTLESIKALDKDNDEIEVIVINGGSTDRTNEIVQSYGAKVIHEPHKSIGFARQEGLKHAQGKIVAFTDADTIVPKNWLIRHVKTLQQNGTVFSYGSFRVSDGAFPYFHFINYLQPHFIWFFHHFLGIPVAAGQNLAFWREKALRIGGFNEKIKIMEDVDLAVRMEKIGQIVFLPDLIVYSSGRRSKEGWGFFLRMFKILFQYFILRRRRLRDFPDFR